MNPEDTAVLENILKQNPIDLTFEDKKFLNARRGYLNDEQRRVFDSVLVKDTPSESGATKTQEEEPIKEVKPIKAKKESEEKFDPFAGSNADPDTQV